MMREKLSCLPRLGLFVICICPSIAIVHSKMRPTSKTFEIITEIERGLQQEHHDMLPNEDTATKVNIDIFVNTLVEVSELNMQFTADLFLTETWTDKRLNLIPFDGSVTLPPRFFDKIWTPDIVFLNEKEGKVHAVTVQNKVVKVNSSGVVQLSLRVSEVLACPMNLSMYPMDEQMCKVQLQSWRYTHEELELNWGDVPVQVGENSHKTKQFLMSNTLVTRCSIQYESMGNFDCLELEIFFRRDLTFYIIEIYIPTALIVATSWLSFWIDYRSTPGRISLGLLSVVTMATQTNEIRSQVPKVSYLKAMDVWVFACQIFVLLSFLEYTLVNVLARQDAESLEQDTHLTPSKKLRHPNRPIGISRSTANSRAKKMDCVARISFPSAFFMFNIMYWLYYLVLFKGES